MALDFTGSTAARVSHGNAAGLANLQVGTIAIWCRPASFSAFRRLMQKGPSSGSFRLFWWTNTGIEFNIARATQSLGVATARTELPALAVDTPCFIAASWNVNSTDDSQHLFAGNASSMAAEATSYTILRRVGSGSIGDDSAHPLIVGNHANFNAAFDGAISFIGIWDRQLSLPEIWQQQLCPEWTEGCVLFSHYLSASGTQLDESGTGANGTPTSTTYATTHAPYAFPEDGSVPSPIPSVGGATIVSASLTDTFTFSDTLTQDTSIIRDQDEGDQTATFDDAITTVVTQGVAGGGVVVNVSIADSFAFSEDFNRNPAVERTLLG